MQWNINKMGLRVQLVPRSDNDIKDWKRERILYPCFKSFSKEDITPNFRHKLASYPLIKEALHGY